MDEDSERPYKVFRRTAEGLELHVASLKDLPEAEKLVASLSEFWPGEYLIRGPE